MPRRFRVETRCRHLATIADHQVGVRPHLLSSPCSRDKFSPVAHRSSVLVPYLCNISFPVTCLYLLVFGGRLARPAYRKEIKESGNYTLSLNIPMRES